MKQITHSLALTLAVLGLAEGARAQQRLHPRVEALRALYQADRGACYREIYREATERAEAAPPRQSLSSRTPRAERRAPLEPPPNLTLDDRFWLRLHAIYSGRRLGEGGRAATTNVTFRTTNFFAPYIGDFHGIWSGMSPSPGAMSQATARDAVGLRAAQLAHMGIDHVKLWYPFNAWKYRQIDNAGGWNSTGGNAGEHSLELLDVVQILGRNAIQVTITMGNSFGTGTLAPQNTMEGRFYFHKVDQSTLTPLPSGLWLMLVDTQADGFYTAPGDDYVNALLGGQFTNFLAGDWRSYASDVATASAQPNVLALQLWNEPEQSGDPGLTNAPDRVGQLIEEARQRASSVSDKLMIGVGSTPTTELFAYLWLDRFVAAGDSWLSNYIRHYGFHAAAALKHTDSTYGDSSRRFPGWPPSPPASSYVPIALYDAGTSGLTVTQLIGGFMALHSGEVAMLEELTIRQFQVQVLTDVDRAFQVQSTGESTVGLGPWSAAAAPRHADCTVLADGTPRLVREALPLQNRWRLMGSGHGASSFTGNGLGPTSAKVHPLTGANPPTLSRSLRPLLVESPRDFTGAGQNESTLLVFADAYDDVPTHCHYLAYPNPASGRLGIWVRGFFKDGSTTNEYASDVVRLSSIITSGTTDWGNLTEDPSFRDVDDNWPSSVTGGWPTSLLPLKGSSLVPPDHAHTLWALTLKDTTKEPFGQLVSLDTTWNRVVSNALRIPIPVDPCNWGGGTTPQPIVANIPEIERELMVREPIQRMVRAAYTGVSGRVAGVFLGQTQSLKTGLPEHHYVLAYHRLVWRYQGSEHYGPAGDARNVSGNATRAWSANYGDFFLNKKDWDFASTVHEPAKMEVVLIDVYLSPSTGQTATLSATASLLPTAGDHPVSPITSPGAEAWDPVVATPGDGTLVIAYRKAQDAYFEFPPEHINSNATPWQPESDEFAVALQSGATFSDSCGTFLPLAYPGSTQRVAWPTFHNAMVVRLFPKDLFLNLRSPGGNWATEQRLSEPAYPGSSFRQETWDSSTGSSWLGELRNLEDRNGVLRTIKGIAGFEKQFHEGWVNSTAQHREVDEANPHTWHPALNPSLSVTPRTGGETIVGIAWSQYPQDLRRVQNAQVDPTSLHPAYAVRGLRLVFDSSNALVTSSSSTSYADYTSNGILGISSPTAVRTANSVQGPVSIVLRPSYSSGWIEGGTSRAFFQMNKTVYGARAGQSGSDFNNSAAGTVRVRSVKAALTPYNTQISVPGGHTELELAAWIQPDATANSKKQHIAYHASQPRRGTAEPGWNSGVQTVGAPFETEDPYAEVIAVFPHVSGTGSSTKGRIVWKADGTIWWVDMTWADQSITPGAVTAANPGSSGTQPGPFPTREVEASAVPSAVAWSRDGTVMTLKFP